MPYKRVGKSVMVRRGGKWRKKGGSKSFAKAKSYLRVLNAVEHGWRPTGRKR